MALVVSFAHRVSRPIVGAGLALVIKAPRTAIREGRHPFRAAGKIADLVRDLVPAIDEPVAIAAVLLIGHDGQHTGGPRLYSGGRAIRH